MEGVSYGHQYKYIRTKRRLTVGQEQRELEFVAGTSVFWFTNHLAFG